MALGTYTEPHSANPGVDYVLREQVPHGDLSQIIINQRAIWGALRTRIIELENGDLGDGFGKAAKTTSSTTFQTLDHSSTAPGPSTAIANDVISGIAGPFKFVNSDVSNAATFAITFTEDFGGANTTRLGITIPILASETVYYTFPFRHKVITPGYVTVNFQVKAGSAGQIAVTSIDNELLFGNYRVVRPI